MDQGQKRLSTEMRDSVVFFRQFRERFQTTGAVLPSSQFLARAMTGPLKNRRSPSRILEVGPGTGAVTREIVRVMRPGDRLDLVEVNESFAELLQRRFREDPRYHRWASQAEVHTCPIQEFHTEVRYDFIVSGLPFNNFSAALVQEILEVLQSLLALNGTLSYFEYMYVRSLKRLVSGSAERDRLRSIDHLMAEMHSGHPVCKNWVFVNLPPAWVHHVRWSGPASGPTEEPITEPGA